jgi:hypothetical protein
MTAHDLGARLRGLLDAVENGAEDSDDLACTLFPQLIDVALAAAKSADDSGGETLVELDDALAALAAALPEPAPGEER